MRYILIWYIQINILYDSGLKMLVFLKDACKILATSIYFPPIKWNKILPTNVYLEGKHRETKDKYPLLSLETCFPFIQWNWKNEPSASAGQAST